MAAIYSATEPERKTYALAGVIAVVALTIVGLTAFLLARRRD